MKQDLSLRLSAYLDGELDNEQTTEIENLLASDPDAQAELDALLQVDTAARADFEAELDVPVSFDLAQMIRTADLGETGNAAPEPLHSDSTVVAMPRRPIWGALAAGIAVFMIGGVGGYAYRDATQPVPNTGWIASIAEYHAVYAGQSRHLVEVGADESDHIETWLGNTVGAEFTIPDLSDHGLTFQGGRLVVANGKPVAQLMYLDANGAVIALCLLANSGGTSGPAEFKETTIGAFDFVSWSGETANYVVIGPQGAPDLANIASAAALDI